MRLFDPMVENIRTCVGGLQQ